MNAPSLGHSAALGRLTRQPIVDPIRHCGRAIGRSEVTRDSSTRAGSPKGRKRYVHPSMAALAASTGGRKSAQGHQNRDTGSAVGPFSLGFPAPRGHPRRAPGEVQSRAELP